MRAGQSVEHCRRSAALSVGAVKFRRSDPGVRRQPSQDHAEGPPGHLRPDYCMVGESDLWAATVEGQCAVGSPDPGKPGLRLGAVSQGCNGRRYDSAGAKYDVLVAVAPYSCWSSKASTGGNTVVVWNTISDGQGMLAHEIGHALGLLHNASKMPTYAEYGSGVDQMGAGSDFYTLRSLAADHRNRLGVLTPLPCATATLRSIFDYPDAIQCGSWFIDYIHDYRDEVWVHKRETVFGGGGGSDTTDYAYLKVGESYKITGGPTIKYNGGGAVSVTP